MSRFTISFEFSPNKEEVEKGIRAALRKGRPRRDWVETLQSIAWTNDRSCVIAVTYGARGEETTKDAILTYLLEQFDPPYESDIDVSIYY